MSKLALVLPGNVQTMVSGGNLYDLRLAEALSTAGHDVAVETVDGHWPAAGVRGERQLASALQRLRHRSAGPGERPVLIDGLIGAACPEVLSAAAAAGMNLHILVHLPLGLEPSLDRTTAVQRDRLERASVLAASSVVTTSAWAAEQLRHRHGIGRVVVAAPGVQPAAAAAGSTPPRLLQLAAVTPGKNQLTVIAALAGLIHFDWTARLVGSTTRNPQYAARVQGAILEADLAERVVLTGEKTGADLDREWHAADLSLLPSSVETYGMVVTESLARGVPVIVTRASGAEEALGLDQHGQRPGAVVAAGSVSALRAELTDWLGGGAARQRARTAAVNRRAMLTGWDETARTVAAALQ